MCVRESPDYMFNITIENAKRLALILLAWLIMCHGVLRLKYGSDPCKWLMEDAHFKEYGCMTHNYTTQDARRCMRSMPERGKLNQIVFVGDARIRNLFIDFVTIVKETPFDTRRENKNINVKFKPISTTMEFLWHPEPDAKLSSIYKAWLTGKTRLRPNLVVTGSPQLTVQHLNDSENALENFTAHLSSTAEHLDGIKNTTEAVWLLQDLIEDQALSINETMLLNERIERCNEIAVKTFANTAVRVWSSTLLMAQQMTGELIQGAQLSPRTFRSLRQYSANKKIPWKGDGVSLSTTRSDAQVLLNFYCNRQGNHEDGTCCRQTEEITILQVIISAVFMLCAASAVGLYVYRRRKQAVRQTAPPGISIDEVTADALEEDPRPPNKDVTGSYLVVLTALTKLGVMMAFFYLCDRTTFFMKEHKQYSALRFSLYLAAAMIPGFLLSKPSDKCHLLHGDQIAEWKGWLLLVILVYNLTGASQVLPLYMLFRVMVSSYLFVTGAGHFNQRWGDGGYSLQAFSRELFRLNLLTVALCFAMNRPYQFYQLVPLVSFWFAILYVTMATLPQVSAKAVDYEPLLYPSLILKFAILITTITLLYVYERSFDILFSTPPLKFLFETSDQSIAEWRFRWANDRYTAVYGMLFAFGYQLLKRGNYVRDTGRESLFSCWASLLAVAVALICLASYGALAGLCGRQEEYDRIHPYITFMPIVAFVLLRNVFGALRTTYSSFFAWFGEISVELFISHCHVWLAADSHGILVLLPSYNVLNLVITSFILVCVSHEIAMVTGTLAQYAVPQEQKHVLRNVVLFCVVLAFVGLDRVWPRT